MLDTVEWWKHKASISKRNLEFWCAKECQNIAAKVWIGVSMMEGEVRFREMAHHITWRRSFCSFLDICLMDWLTASILEVSGSKRVQSPWTHASATSMCTTLEGTSDMARPPSRIRCFPGGLSAGSLIVLIVGCGERAWLLAYGTLYSPIWISPFCTTAQV